MEAARKPVEELVIKAAHWLRLGVETIGAAMVCSSARRV